LERHLHPDGLHCPHCRSAARRVFRAQGHFPAYRGRACDGSYTLLTGTVFAKTRQRASTLVLLLRGMARYGPTARLAHELGLSRKQLRILWEIVHIRGADSRIHQEFSILVPPNVFLLCLIALIEQHVWV
jgi:hypothetical protein